MIRRDDHNDWLLIPQMEHARLAGEIAACWGNDQVPRFPESDELVEAIGHHDDGWSEWDAAPRIDPENDIPRSFTEMQMCTATEIWTRSIDICSRETSWYISAVRKSQILGTMWQLDPVFHEILCMQPRFQHDELFRRLEALELPRRVSRSGLYRALHWLEEAGWILKLPGSGVDAEYERIMPTRPPSPLGGIAVSKHFCWLAEQARENRVNEGELNCLDEFLDAQNTLQRKCHSAIPGRGLSTAELDNRIEEAYRSVQFFDRLSLWMCCAQRTESFQIECPDLGPVEFGPRSSGTIAVKPFPFSFDRVLHANQPMSFSVSAKRIAQRRYADDADLQTALHDAKAETINWTFTPW